MPTGADGCKHVRADECQTPWFPGTFVANCRHWSPMIANGRQWSPLVATGRQWFGGRSTSPAPYQRTARRPHATVRPRIPQRHHIRLIGSYVGQPVRKNSSYGQFQFHAGPPPPAPPAFKVERKANAECIATRRRRDPCQRNTTLWAGGLGGGSMDWEGPDSCRSEGAGMGDMGWSWTFCFLTGGML